MKWSIFMFVGRVIFLGVCDHTHEPLLSIDGKEADGSERVLTRSWAHGRDHQPLQDLVESESQCP